MVREALNASGGDLLVFEPGVTKPDPLGKWVFAARLAGLDTLPDYCPH